METQQLHRGRLIDQVDLEADKVRYLARVVHRDGHACDQVDERLAALVVVDQRHLRLLASLDVLAKVMRSVAIRVTTLLALYDRLIARSLQEAACC